MDVFRDKIVILLEGSWDSAVTILRPRPGDVPPGMVMCGIFVFCEVGVLN